jgi:hypothetical protein
MQMYVPLRCTGTATETHASANTRDTSPQVGLSNATYATKPLPKNVDTRPWSDRKTGPAPEIPPSQSCSEPTALTERTAVPQQLHRVNIRPHQFARQRLVPRVTREKPPAWLPRSNCVRRTSNGVFTGIYFALVNPAMEYSPLPPMIPMRLATPLSSLPADFVLAILFFS